MKFVIEIAVATHDKNKYNVGGYLCPEDNNKDEEELIDLIIDALDDCIKAYDNYDFSKSIIAKDKKVVYCNVPIVTCSNMMKVYATSLGIDINTSVASNVKVIPESCTDLFKMEVNRLF